MIVNEKKEEDKCLKSHLRSSEARVGGSSVGLPGAHAGLVQGVVETERMFRTLSEKEGTTDAGERSAAFILSTWAEEQVEENLQFFLVESKQASQKGSISAELEG